MEKADTFFEFAAEVGLTKHLGNVDATNELVRECHIEKGSYVLDVGCGAGVTACFLAKQYGCQVMGIDILEGMVEKSRRRATKEKLTHLVSFRTADAQDLPFEEDTFDAVLTESVTAFPTDKQKAVNEYVRVLKPGGFVGLNESTWLKSPQTPEINSWVSQEIGATVSPLSEKEWKGLLAAAGLEKIKSSIKHINIRDESRGIIKRYGCGGILGVMLQTFRLYLRNPNYRRFVKRVNKRGVTPKNLTDYFGYGIYIGSKQE